MSKLQSALEEEHQKFQAETLRTSRLSKALYHLAQQLIWDGHSIVKWSKNDSKCELLQEAMEALKDTIYYDELKAEANHV